MSKTVQSISDPQCNDSVFLKKSTALYIRVSTDRQVLEGESLRAQEEILKEYCKYNGISEYKIYRDEGCSAKQKYNKRPVMMKLLSDIEAGKIHQVLFIKLDRWMRNVAEYHKVQEILDRNHCSWRAILEEYETETANGRMTMTESSPTPLFLLQPFTIPEQT